VIPGIYLRRKFVTNGERIDKMHAEYSTGLQKIAEMKEIQNST
jgi:hypothetical protein